MTHDLTARRHDVDWLRVAATYLLFVFHAGKVFDPAPFYHVRNDELSFAMLVVCGFISLWHMPLFFLLAGWSLVSSLRARGGVGLARERLLRLGVPLLAGCILLGPLIKYLELRSGLDLSHTGLRASPALQDGFKMVSPSGLAVMPPFDQSFLDFLPTFFTHLDRFTWSHLWFVAYLLVFTLLLLPMFVRLLRSGAALDDLPAIWVYAPILPLAVIQVTLRPRWPGIQNLYDDWANVAYYATFLVAGFVIARSPALERRVDEEWPRAVGIALVTTVVLLLGVLGTIRSSTLILAGTAVAGWCFVVASLGVARRFLSWRTPSLDYLAESAFPVYVLHQTAIVVCGYFLVLPLPLGVAAKFCLLVAVSVAVTMGTYHFAVRPFALPRFLVGMKPRACALPLWRVAPRVAMLFLAASVGTVAGPGDVQAAGSPLGLWYAEGGAAQVAIEHCERTLCGRVVWLRSPFDEDGCELLDRHNPEQGLRLRPVLGIEIMRGLAPSPGESDVWVGGEIYDPASGRTYRCELSLD
ncbi:MAG: acyltransferase family protein, partial [Candidatus Binatia bacterium]